jgi:hypothetical protein
MLVAVIESASERKLRLFAVAAWRHIRNDREYERLVRAVDAAERYADGLIDRRELRNAKSLARDRVGWLQRVHDAIPYLRGRQPRVQVLAVAACEEFFPALGEGVLEAASWEELRSFAPAVIRDLFGDSFRAVTVDPRCLTAGVTRLAGSIYDERAFHCLTLLADALEEAGCTDSAILSHCRSGQEHVRGCWVLDQLLSKS